MKNDIFIPIYFSGLYTADNQEKINIFSYEFFEDVYTFYLSLNTDDQRDRIIKGIRYLCSGVKNQNELLDVILIWEHEKKSIQLHAAFESARNRPKGSADFLDKVDSVLDSKREQLAKLARSKSDLIAKLTAYNIKVNDHIDRILINKKPSKKERITTGFVSNLTDEQVSKLYTKMSVEYVEASFDHFRAVFKTDPLPSGCLIRWKSSERLLGYFMEELKHYKFIGKESEINKILKSCFLNKIDKPIGNSIKQNRSGSANNKKGTGDIGKPTGYVEGV